VFGISRAGRDYIWLTVIVLAGFVLRLWAIKDAVAGDVLGDPDKYVEFAQRLGNGTQSWKWTFDAVTYGEFFRAPLYPLLLSIITTNGLGIVAWGLTVHAILNTCSIVSMYVIGRSLHTSRAGLIAAAVYALWVPNVRLTASFWQEHLYVPLLLAAFALLGRAIERPAHKTFWVLSGATFAAASLTRSAALYFIPFAVLWVWFRMPERQHRRAVALFAGTIALVTLPYVVALSLAIGRFIPIEDVGSYGLKAYYSVSPSDSSITLSRYAPNPNIGPTGFQVARFLAADFLAGPAAFASGRMNMARLLWKPAGGSIILGSIQPDRRAASRHRVWTHLTMDLPFVLALLLFPIGFAVSRQSDFAVLLLMWILQSTVLQALVMWAGLRYRSPIEPAVIVLASVAIAGQWSKPGWSRALVAALVLVAAGASLAANADAFQPRANYGVNAWPPDRGATSTFTGGAGLRGMLRGGEVSLMVEAQGSAETSITVRLDGRVIDSLILPPRQPRLLTYRDAGGGAGYLELEARSASGEAATVSVAPR
jgi:4-amino-4-deoxy-L-arabinose transferase-like glycosyltransferase